MWATNPDFRNVFANNSDLNGGGASNWNSDPSRSAGAFYFIEIKRLTTTTFSISFSSTDSYDGDLASSGSQTCSADTKDMRYIYMCSENAGATECGHDCLIDNIEFYDGYITPTTVAKPTNVQVGSRFEETDTRKMYHYEAGSPTYTGNMGTGWTTTGSDFTIDTTDNEVDYLGTYNAQNVYFDLETVETLSTSKFLIRFTIKQTGTASGDSPVFWFGCSETGVTASNSTATDFIGFSNHVSAGTAVLRPYQSMGDDDRLDQTDVQSRLQLSGSNVDLANDNTLYYYEIVRDGSNFTSNVYSDSGYSTLLATRTNAVPAGGETLRYFIIANYIQGSGVTGTFGNFLWYNGVITPVIPDAWTEEGT
jgi:hypothetical protein